MIFRAFSYSALAWGRDSTAFCKLRVVFEIDFVAFGQAEDGDERFFPDFALDPGKILSDIVLGVRDLFLVEVGVNFFITSSSATNSLVISGFGPRK